MLAPKTRSRWTRRGIALAFVGAAVAAMTGDAASQPLPQPQPAPKLQPVPAPALPARSVAVLHGNIEITHDEFGKFLMDRGGADKLEIFVNKKIIELEAKRLGLTVTDTELKAAFKQSVATSGAAGDGVVISEKDFIRVVLPKFGKNLYEWMEDIERPRLLLTKMCRSRIAITEADLKLQFDRRYGEMRQVQMIMWPTGDDEKAILKLWDKIRESGNEFDSEARRQANPGLAAACGHIKPITRHLPSDDKQVEDVAFKLKDGEVSHLIHTAQGYIVMKLVKVIPANTAVKFEAERAVLEKAAFEARLEAEIPKCFAELRKAADPKFLYSGPGEWKGNTNFLDSIPDVIKGASATNSTVPTPGGR